MKYTKRPKRVHQNTQDHTALDKVVRFELNSHLYAALTKIAEAEGREQGRPKSVSSVMRKMLQAGVDARSK